MVLSTIYNTKAIAINRTSVASNQIPYLGLALFPAKKKMGLDLKWIKTSKGLPVSLAPSNFDAMPYIRTRSGFQIDKQEMAFFREAMDVRESDEQEIMRVQEASDPFAQEVLNSIYDDVNTLVDAADVVPERMRMQLLFPTVAGPAISIADARGTTYSYKYDGDGTWLTNNKTTLLATLQWPQTTTAKPLTDIKNVKDALAALGSTPAYMIMNTTTFNLFAENTQVNSAILAQNSTANIFLDDDMVKEFLTKKTKMQVIVYDKLVKDEAGTTVKLVPDYYVAFIPEGALGSTWYGMTPEERTAMSVTGVDVTILGPGGAGPAVAVKTEYGPPAITKTIVSEIVLPSYERMDECYLLKVFTAIAGTAFTGVAADGSVASNTKVTLTPSAAGTGYLYKIKQTSTLPLWGEDVTSWTTYTSAADFACDNGDALVIAKCTTAGLTVDAVAFVAVVA